MLLAAASLAVFFLPTALPGGEAANRPLIVVRGVLTGQRALVRDGLYYLPASLVRDYLDPAARVINRNGLPVLTTGDLRVDTGDRFLDDYVNGTSNTEGGRRSLRLEIPLLEEGWGGLPSGRPGGNPLRDPTAAPPGVRPGYPGRARGNGFQEGQGSCRQPPHQPHLGTGHPP